MNQSGDKMVIDLTGLNNRLKQAIEFSCEYEFSEEELENTDVTSIENLSVTGVIRLNAINNLVLDIDVSGIMIIPCAITLKPVSYDFDININEEIDSYSDTNNINTQNSIDILPIIWENILLEIPMRVVSETTEPIVNDGSWSFIKDE